MKQTLCIFDECIGMARSYTNLKDNLGYDGFDDEIRAGLNYVSDGRSHIFNFAIDDARVTDNKNEHQMDKAGKVTITSRRIPRRETNQSRSTHPTPSTSSWTANPSGAPKKAYNGAATP